MPAIMFALSLLLLLASPLQAADMPQAAPPTSVPAMPVPNYPVNKADYMKAQEAQFDEADKNKNGTLEKEELPGAFQKADTLTYISDDTLAACKQAGHDLKAHAAPEDMQQAQKDYKPMTKAQFLDVKRHLFEHMDANEDKQVTLDEAKHADAQMKATCLAMPNMAAQMETFKKMHEARVNNKAGNDMNALRKQQEEMMKQVQELQKTMPKPQDLQLPAGAGQ